MWRPAGKPADSPAAIGENHRSPGVRKDQKSRPPFSRFRWDLGDRPRLAQNQCQAVVAEIEHEMMMSISHNSFSSAAANLVNAGSAVDAPLKSMVGPVGEEHAGIAPSPEAGHCC